MWIIWILLFFPAFFAPPSPNRDNSQRNIEAYFLRRRHFNNYEHTHTKKQYRDRRFLYCLAITSFHIYCIALSPSFSALHFPGLFPSLRCSSIYLSAFVRLVPSASYILPYSLFSCLLLNPSDFIFLWEGWFYLLDFYTSTPPYYELYNNMMYAFFVFLAIVLLFLAIFD